MATSNAFEPTGTTLSFTPTGGSAFTLHYVTVTPPAWEGEDAIDITNLSNASYKTKMPKTLIDIGDCSFTAEYEPNKVSTAPINSAGVITITIPNWGTWTLQGYLKSIKPDELKVGERAMCSGEFVVTNTVVSGTGSARTVTETGPSWSGV